MYAQNNTSLVTSILRSVFLYCAIATVWLSATRAARAEEEIQAWEYNPYRIHCWLSIDPALGWREETLKQVSEGAIDSIESRFGPAAEVTSEKVPSEFEGDILYPRDSFTLDRLLGREMVLATSRKNDEGKEARTFAYCMEKFQNIPINALYLESLKEDLARFPDFKEGQEIGTRVKAAEGPTTDSDGNDPVAKALIEGKIPVALISRAMAKSSKDLRPIPLVYPWQLQSELSSRDKILTICFRRVDIGVSVELREIDCMFRTLGTPYQTVVTTPIEFGDAIATLSARAFIPLARLEGADEVNAKVRVRAGELIPKDSAAFNPCNITKGDVLRPTIRRDAMNGEPTMIQAVPWTYIVAYDQRQSNLDCAIYSGMRGALMGRPNRRMHRMALLVRPTYESTDLKLRVASTKAVVPGDSVFRRTPGREDLELLGRSDWRGVFQIKERENPIVQYELPVADPAADPNAKPAAAPATADAKATPAKPAAPATGEIQTNVPLYIYFIKSGNALLAKVPIVTGDEPLQIADLVDDSRRLEAEAFIRGLEGRIFDVVALRLILAQKIDKALDENTPAGLKEAQELLLQLKTTKNYESFSQDLGAIQKRILSPENGTIPKGAQKRIDKMFDDTRLSLQKYLQENDVRELEGRVIEMKKQFGTGE